MLSLDGSSLLMRFFKKPLDIFLWKLSLFSLLLSLFHGIMKELFFLF
jgi:hypothetical protein